MSEEEKELIKELERKSNLVATEYEIFIERNELLTILNLIDKLQKENKNIKDKIRDKIKEYQDKGCEDMQTILIKHLIIEMLEELLKEN